MQILEIKWKICVLGFFANLMWLKTFDFYSLEIVCFLQQEAKALGSDGFLTWC